MLSELLHVDLSESYVLRWLSDGRAVVFDLDIALFPEHPRYSSPLPEEWTCYRAGQLIFNDCTSVIGLKEMTSVTPAVDASGEVDYGHIDTFEIVNQSSYALAGEFGHVLICAASEPTLSFSDE